MGGLRVTPDIALADLRPEDSAMLILAGGDLWTETSMPGFRAAARRFLAAGVPVAAICGATFGLASWFKLYGDRDPAGFFELTSA